MSTAPSRLDSTISFFQKNGSRAVREYDYSAHRSQSQITYYCEAVRTGVEGVAMPVYAACLLGFSAPLIAETIRRSGFNIHHPTSHFEINGTDDHVIRGYAPMNSVGLFKKIVETMPLLIPDQDELARVLINAMGKGHSILGLAVMGLGIEGVNPATMIQSQIEFLASPPKNAALRMPHMGGLVYSSSLEIATLSDIIANINLISDLPNGSTIDFLEGSGALLPAVTRKAVGPGFWEEVMFSATHGNDGLHHLLRDFIEHYPEQALSTFKSLDFCTCEKMPSLENFEYLQDMVESAFSRKGLGSIKDDVSYQLGMITAYANESEADVVDFSIDAGVADEVFFQSASQSNFERLRDLGSDLANQLMLSHISIGEDHLGMSNFKSWWWISRFNPVPQQVDPTLLSAYLGYMARGSESLYPKGHEQTQHYKFIVAELDEAMTRFTDLYRDTVDYSTLKGLGEDIKLSLVKWGLDVSKLEVKRGSTLDLAFSADLGI